MTVTCQFKVYKLREKKLVDVIEDDYKILTILQYWTRISHIMVIILSVIYLS